MPTCTCRSRTCSRTLGSRRARSPPIALPLRGGRSSARRTGASRTSRPSASRTRTSPPCSAGEGGTLAAGRAVHFCFALGKANEDRGDYDTAWEWYQRGNQHQRPLVSHDPLVMEKPPLGDHRHLQRRIPARARGPRLRRRPTDLHRRPAPLGLDADRADPRLALAGRGHGGTAQPRADRRLGRPLPERPGRLPGSRA